MKTELESVAEQLSELRLTQMRLEAEHFKAKVAPMINAAIGKNYAYRDNNYGGDGHWDTFRKLLSAAFSKYSAWLIFEQCQIDCEGKGTIATAVELVPLGSKTLPILERGWRECAPEEYARRRSETLAEISNPVRHIEHLSSR